MLHVRSLACCAVASVSLFVVPASAQTPEPGVLWENTVQMDMQGGMTLPATTTTFCAPKDGLKEPPQPKDEKSDCRVENMKNDGKKMSWTMACTGEHPMKGEGQLTYGPKTFDGLVTMRMAEGEMKMKLSGKNLGQACDAGAVKRQVAALQAQQSQLQAQSDAAMAQLCRDGQRDMAVMLFSGPGAMCKDPAQLKALCDRYQTREGFEVASGHGDAQLQQIGQACKVEPAQVRKKLCPAAGKAAQGARPDAADLQFVGANCPDEARAIAKAECAGRSFTGMEQGPMTDFCVRYARKLLTAEELGPKGGTTQPAKAEPKSEAVETGKKLLKGFFGK